jgi:thiol-disulfide isomerase/thioredoxin
MRLLYNNEHMDTKVVIGVIVGALVLVFGGAMIASSTGSQAASPAMTSFAQCLAENDATFYGAFWCPHCQDQKEMFGGAKDELPYVECSTPSGNGQRQVCREAGIETYPTWEFADGSRETGVLSIDTLAEQTSCSAPQSS